MSNFDLYRMLFTLAEGYTIQVKLEQIYDQLKRDLFTGIDMLSGLRDEDIKGWMENTMKNHDMDITYDGFSEVMTFHRRKRSENTDVVECNTIDDTCMVGEYLCCSKDIS